MSQPEQPFGQSLLVNVDSQACVRYCPDQPYLLINVSVSAQPHTAPKIPYGYEHLGGIGYYKFHTDSKTWFDALLTCHSEGAHLAVINSALEDSLLKDLFSRYNNLYGAQDVNSVFIGFHDLYEEGYFMTIFSEPLKDAGYINWETGQPDNGGGRYGGGEDCGVMYRDGSLGDTWCNFQHAYICEIDL
ncbi:hemolymph lipopolysaccharide-binding protein-like [Periplaneta americana]|uniref:hemolymph lipopolysaccharide-binding protein-like n=1 Tax=Periplaneta americana TaxID=6978 RepID=UPI0037E7FF56